MHLEIQFWHLTKTEKHSGLNSLRFFLLHVTFTVSPTRGTGSAQLCCPAQGEPQLGGGIMRRICHRKGLVLCSPMSNMTAGEGLTSACTAVTYKQARDQTKQLVIGSGDSCSGHSPTYCDKVRGKNCFHLVLKKREGGTAACSCCVWSIQVHWVLRIMGFLGTNTGSSLWGVKGLLCEGSSHGVPWHGPCPYFWAPSQSLSRWAEQEGGSSMSHPGAWGRTGARHTCRGQGMSQSGLEAVQASSWEMSWPRSTGGWARLPLWQRGPGEFWHQKILSGFLW